MNSKTKCMIFLISATISAMFWLWFAGQLLTTGSFHPCVLCLAGGTAIISLLAFLGKEM